VEGINSLAPILLSIVVALAAAIIVGALNGLVIEKPFEFNRLLSPWLP